jgi:hypothetical protein
MEFYYFGGSFSPGHLDEIKDANFSGVMFTYDVTQGDIFTKIVEQIQPNENIKYLVAIRPYAISPQYLCMISNSMNSIIKNKLQINFISGYIKEHEKSFGGIIEKPDDLSSNVDRSDYLIKYLNVLNTMLGNKNTQYPLDFYVSTSNEFIENVVNKYNNKIILPYKNYKNGYWQKIDKETGKTSVGVSLNLDYNKAMLAITPIIRENKKQLEELPEGYANRPVWREGENLDSAVSDIDFFTYDEFNNFVAGLEEKGISQLLINAWPQEEDKIIKKYVKHYTKLKELEKSI